MGGLPEGHGAERGHDKALRTPHQIRLESSIFLTNVMMIGSNLWIFAFSVILISLRHVRGLKKKRSIAEIKTISIL
jgi:hypothetical protein